MIKKTLTFTFLILAGKGTAFAQEDIVNIYNWSDYIGENTLEEFQAETGIKPNYDVFDTNEILEAKLLAGSSGYDVVVPTDNFMARQAEAGIFQPIDKSALENYGNIDPVILEIVSANDPGNTYGVPYMWATIGIGYNVDAVSERIEPDKIGTWDMIFDPETVAKLADCGVTVLDSPTEVVGAALHYLGLDPNSEDPDDLAQATELMQAVRPHLRYIHSSQYINDLANGEICAVIGYSGDVLIARDRAIEAEQGLDIAYSIPPNGAQIGFDMMGIPADAPNAHNALEYIDYILRPEVAADITNTVFFANPNVAATPLVDPEILNNPGVYPSEEIKAQLFTLKPKSPRFDRLLTRAWTNIKTGQ